MHDTVLCPLIGETEHSSRCVLSISALATVVNIALERLAPPFRQSFSPRSLGELWTYFGGIKLSVLGKSVLDCLPHVGHNS